MSAKATRAQPFLFGEDLRQAGPDAKTSAARLAERAALEAAERQAFAAGEAEGRRAAEAEVQHRLAEAAERIGTGIVAAVAAIDGRVAIVEDEAIALFGELAGKLAGQALGTHPLAAAAEAAREAFAHLRGVPHLVVRVSPALVEEMDQFLARLARERGFEGRLIVIGDDELRDGDIRLDWADGGVVRDRGAFEAAATVVLARAAAAEARDDVAPNQEMPS